MTTRISWATSRSIRCATLGALLFATGAHAQVPVIAPKADADDLRITLSGGLWATAISGTIGVKGLTTDTTITFSELLENLDLAAFPGFIISKGNWQFLMGGMFAHLSADKTGPLGRDTELTMDEYIVDLAVGYTVWDIKLDESPDSARRFTFTPGIGARLTSIHLDITPPGPILSERSGTETWVDPYVGARASFQFAKEWSVTAQGSVGGFGVGSDFAWSAGASVDWQFSQGWVASLGYRAMYWDYSSGGFTWDVTMYGPTINLSYTF